MISLRFGHLMLYALLAWETAGAQTPWRAISNSRQMNISGMTLVEHNDLLTTFIVVHDNKKKAQPHVGLVTIVGREAPRYTPLEWAGDDVPVDLEAIASVPTTSTRSFMAFTSAGKIYHIRFDHTGNRVELIKSFAVPAIPAGSNFEGFDLQVIGDTLVAVWAERGADSKPATVFWSKFDLRNYAFVQLDSASVRVPYPITNVRHIADVKVDSTGAVFISATSDPSNDGPFSSAVYYAGTFSVCDHKKINFIQPALLTRLFQFSGHKVEGIELVPGVSGGMAFGSDDENMGAAIYVPW